MADGGDSNVGLLIALFRPGPSGIGPAGVKAIALYLRGFESVVYGVETGIGPIPS